MEMWVRNRTPENEALNGTVMYGRTIELIGGAPKEMWEEMKKTEPASRDRGQIEVQKRNCCIFEMTGPKCRQ